MCNFHRIRIVLLAFAIAFSGSAAARSSLETSPSGSFVSASRILIQNAALVITMDPALGEGPLGIIEPGDVLFTRDRIVAVGKRLKASDARVLDATGKIVLPGFVDVHNHLWQSIIRGCGTDQDLLGWLDQCVFPMFKGIINEQEAYASVRLSTLDLIATGVTTVLDWSHGFTSEFVKGNLRALHDSGLRFVYAYWVTQPNHDEVRRIKKELIDTNPRARFQIAAHPSMKLLEDLTKAAQLAQELHVPLNLHVNENIKEREDEPFKAMELAGAFKVQLVANHAVHLTNQEIALLARHGTRVTHNPLSNMRLASGIMRLPEMHAAGVAVGLGLDGGTNDTSDMFANMKAAVGLQRARFQRADTFPTLAEVLRMATLGGTEVLDMEEAIGSLTPGKKADLIILDPSAINFAPRFDWISQIVLNGQPTNVEYVFVDGRPLKAGGKLVGVSGTAIVQAAEQAAQRIKKALEELKNEQVQIGSD